MGLKCLLKVSAKPVKNTMLNLKRKKPVRVASRSLKLLRDDGWIAQVVEQTIPRVFIKRDYIGCIDIIAFHPDRHITMGVQVTTAAHMSDHVKKILAEPRVEKWIQCGNKMVVHAWSKKGKKDSRKLWTMTERIILLSEYTKTDEKGGDVK